MWNCIVDHRRTKQVTSYMPTVGGAVGKELQASMATTTCNHREWHTNRNDNVPMVWLEDPQLHDTCAMLEVSNLGVGATKRLAHDIAEQAAGAPRTAP